MRLWHWKLLPYVPKLQILAQWRELNSIFKKQDKHILINYIYKYENNKSDDLFDYTCLVINEMKKRNIKIKSYENIFNYFGCDYDKEYMNYRINNFTTPNYNIFYNHHTDRYLKQCFYNLQEKYDRGQKDFDRETYLKLEQFVNRYLNRGE